MVSDIIVSESDVAIIGEMGALNGGGREGTGIEIDAFLRMSHCN